MALDDDALPGEDDRHTEVRSAIDRIAEEAATKAGRRAARRAAGGYFALLAVLLIGATVYSHVTETRLHDGLRASCARVDRLRVQESNRNAQVLWAALYNAREREAGLARMPGPDRALHRASVRYLNVSVDALRWTPSTNCDAAVENPKSYRPPAPRPFTARFLDLTVIPK